MFARSMQRDVRPTFSARRRRLVGNKLVLNVGPMLLLLQVLVCLPRTRLFIYFVSTHIRALKIITVYNRTIHCKVWSGQSN